MTNEERDLITRFIERAGGAQQGGFAPAGQGGTPQLPPIDPEADRLIADLFTRYPEARYRITQMAVVQEHALVEAQNRIQRLEWEVQQARQQAAAPSAQSQPSPWGAGAQAGQPPGRPGSSGFFGSLFGGGRQAPPPQQPQYAQQQYAPQPPPPQYPPGYNPGMFQQRGSGFLGSALTTAAGVAGGMLAANALTSMFSGHHAGFGSAAASGTEFLPVPPAADANPWAAPGGASPVTDPYDIGGAQKSPDDTGWATPDQGQADPGQVDQGGWSQPTSDQGGWDQVGGMDDQSTIDTSGDWSDPGGSNDDWT